MHLLLRALLSCNARTPCWAASRCRVNITWGSVASPAGRSRVLCCAAAAHVQPAACACPAAHCTECQVSESTYTRRAQRCQGRRDVLRNHTEGPTPLHTRRAATSAPAAPACCMHAWLSKARPAEQCVLRAGTNAAPQSRDRWCCWGRGARFQVALGRRADAHALPVLLPARASAALEGSPRGRGRHGCGEAGGQADVPATARPGSSPCTCMYPGVPAGLFLNTASELAHDNPHAEKRRLPCRCRPRFASASRQSCSWVARDACLSLA